MQIDCYFQPTVHTKHRILVCRKRTMGIEMECSIPGEEAISVLIILSEFRRIFRLNIIINTKVNNLAYILRSFKSRVTIFASLSLMIDCIIEQKTFHFEVFQSTPLLQPMILFPFIVLYIPPLVSDRKL